MPKLFKVRIGGLSRRSRKFDAALEALRYLRRAGCRKPDHTSVLAVIDGRALPISLAELEALALTERLSLTSKH